MTLRLDCHRLERDKKVSKTYQGVTTATHGRLGRVEERNGRHFGFVNCAFGSVSLGGGLKTAVPEAPGGEKWEGEGQGEEDGEKSDWAWGRGGNRVSPKLWKTHL